MYNSTTIQIAITASHWEPAHRSRVPSSLPSMGSPLPGKTTQDCHTNLHTIHPNCQGCVVSI